jgi:hypothetical protein
MRDGSDVLVRLAAVIVAPHAGRHEYFRQVLFAKVATGTPKLSRRHQTSGKLPQLRPFRADSLARWREIP